MDTIQLLGCGYAHPATHVSNHELEKTIDTSDEWIVQRTGIHARYVAVNETTSMLAAEAGEKALLDAGVDKADIRLLIVATLTADQANAFHSVSGAGKNGNDGSADHGI